MLLGLDAFLLAATAMPLGSVSPFLIPLAFLVTVLIRVEYSDNFPQRLVVLTGLQVGRLRRRRRAWR